MGSLASKLFYPHDQDHDLSRKNDDSNLPTSTKYVRTPPMKRKILLTDPRSATTGIPRTPIDVTPKKNETETTKTASAIPRRLQVKPYLETNFDETLPTQVIADPLDPRSPNVSQPRTPIVIPCSPNSEIVEIPEKIINQYQDPRSPSFDFDRTPILKPKSPQNSHKQSHLAFCETTYDNIPEVQALPDIVQNAKFPRQKLEDTLLQNDDNDDNNSKENSNSETEKERTDPHPSPAAEKEILHSSTQELINNILLTALKRIEEEGNEKIHIWEDPEVKGEKVVDNKVSETENRDKEVIIDVEAEEKYEKEDCKEAKPKETGNKQCSSAPNSMSRTPLQNRSNNYVNVHKLPKNSTTQPMTKSKGIFTISQQENTPPGKKSSKKKQNLSQWDPNNTVLI